MNNEDMSNVISKFSEFMNSSSNSEKPSISPEMLANMAKMFNSNSSNNQSSNTDELNNSNNSSNSTSSGPNFDMETILKIKSIFDQMNKKDDPRSNLLLSLKPYLKESRKNKLDQYIQFFNMSKIFETFNKSGGGSK